MTTTDGAAVARPRDGRPADPRPGEPTILPGERIAPRPVPGSASSGNGSDPSTNGHGPSTNGHAPSTNGHGPSPAASAERSTEPATRPDGQLPLRTDGQSGGPRGADGPSTTPETDAARSPLADGHAQRPYSDGHATPAATPPGAPIANGCTAPQLRRFIKSRPYVPMHELRRRFGILGTDDDVTQVRLDHQAIYVGLPQREGALLGDLLRGGEIGCELSLDPRTPVVIGVYPMRPVPRG